MHNKTLNALLLSAITLGASAIAGQAAAQGMQDRGISGDRYGYVMRQGKPDPFTDGANAIGKRDPFTDGGHVTDKRDAFTDGGHSAGAGLNVAGMDHSGVSAPPAHGAALADANA